MSAKQARQRYVAGLWSRLEVEDQWALLFGIERKQLTAAHRKALRGAGVMNRHDDELTPTGREVRDHGKAIYDATPD